MAKRKTRRYIVTTGGTPQVYETTDEPKKRGAIGAARRPRKGASTLARNDAAHSPDHHAPAPTPAEQRKAITDRAARGELNPIEAADKLRELGLSPRGKSPGRTTLAPGGPLERAIGGAGLDVFRGMTLGARAVAPIELASLLATGDANPARGVERVRGDVQAGMQTLQDPHATFTDRLRAAGGIGLQTGAIGGNDVFDTLPLKFRKPRTRTLTHGGLEVNVPAAGSFAGRSVERLADTLRQPVSKATGGLVKSSDAKLGEEFGRSQRIQTKIDTSPAKALQRLGRKLKPEEQYALRVVNEGATPEERVAHHTALADAAEKPLDRLFHSVHADLSHASSKYIEQGPDGTLQLRADAPEKLREANDLLGRVATTRENIYRDLGRLGDEEIMSRLSAPGRVVKGARYRSNEYIVRKQLEANPQRAEIHQLWDQTLPPEEAGLAKDLWDSAARSYAERHAEDIGTYQQHLDDFFAHSAGTATEPPAGNLAERAGIQDLYQTAPAPEPIPHVAGSDITARVLERGFKLPKNVTPEEFAGSIDRVMELVAEGAPYRDWYSRGAHVIADVAKRLKVPVRRFAALVAVTSQGANPTFNLRLAAKAAQEFKATGKVEATRYIFNQREAEQALRGVIPETAKRNSYYANFMHELQPKQFAKEFGDRTDPVTVDRHVTRMFLPNVSSPGKHYDLIESVFQEIARDLGWTAKEVQAAAWVPWKAQGLAASTAKRAATKGKLADASYERFLPTAADAYEKGHAENIGTLYQKAASDLERGVGDTLGGAGGHTWNADLTTDAGSDGFAVSVKGHEQQIPSDQFGVEDVLRYRAAHAKTFDADPTLKVGAWRDNGTVYLDASKIVPDLEQALQLGRDNEQLAIYDRAKSEVIEVAGEPTAAAVRAGMNEPTQFGGPDAGFAEYHAQVARPGEGVAGGTVKGAVRFLEDGRFILHAVQGNADLSTAAHELAHVLRRYALSDRDQQIASKWAGAGDGWTTDAEEKFARGFEQYLREGQAPSPRLRKVFTAMGKLLADLVNRHDIPDVSPEMRRVFDRLLGYKKLKGGSLIGAEDFEGGVNYVPYVRGMPIPVSSPFSAFGAYMRNASTLFGGGARSAIGAGPTDKSLVKAFKGGLLLSGFFKADVTEGSAKSLMVAARLSAAHRARALLLQAATELPQAADDIAIKIDPTKELPQDVKDLWDRLDGAALSENKLGRDELEKIDLETADAIRQQVLPAEVDGVRVEELARQLHEEADLAEPVDNIRWISRDILSHSELLPSKWDRAGRGPGWLTADAFNDVSKAAVLYLNPAYAPVNLIGNLTMNLLQQGPFALANIPKAAALHWHMSVEELTLLDDLMGHGLTESAALSRGPKALTHGLAHAIGQVVDLIPRRAAFLHEARRSGYKSLEDVKGLLADRSPQGRAELEQITRRANDAIVDYERLSPFERNVVTRVIFFYPWIKGATRYSLRFAVDHPYETAALAYLETRRENLADDKLGKKRPFYDKLDIPIGTESIPGVGDLPQVINPRQAFTQTTPMELVDTAKALVTGGANEPQAVENLAPFLHAAGVALFGYDPFTHKEVPATIGTFFNQATEGLPPQRIYDALTMSEKDRRKKNARAIHPRTREDEIKRVFFGGLTPTAYNAKAAHQALGEGHQSHADKAETWIKTQESHLGELPESVRASAMSKAFYQDLQDHLKDQLDVRKLTDKQRTALKLAALIHEHPGYARAGDQLRELVRQADLSTLPTVDSWIEDKLGWNLLEAISEKTNRLEKAGAGSAAP